jgi:hypothetical protein
MNSGEAITVIFLKLVLSNMRYEEKRFTSVICGTNRQFANLARTLSYISQLEAKEET